MDTSVGEIEEPTAVPAQVLEVVEEEKEQSHYVTLGQGTPARSNNNSRVLRQPEEPKPREPSSLRQAVVETVAPATERSMAPRKLEVRQAPFISSRGSTGRVESTPSQVYEAIVAYNKLAMTSLSAESFRECLVYLRRAEGLIQDTRQRMLLSGNSRDF